MSSTKLIVWSVVMLNHLLNVVMMDGEDNPENVSNCSSNSEAWYSVKDVGGRYCCPCCNCGIYGDIASEYAITECMQIPHALDQKRVCEVQPNLFFEKCVEEETFLRLSTTAPTTVGLNAPNSTYTTTAGLNNNVQSTTLIIITDSPNYLLILFVAIPVILCGLAACVCYRNRSAVKMLCNLVPNKKHKTDSVKDNSSDVSEVLDSQSDQEKVSIDENQNKKYGNTLVLDIKDEAVTKICESYDGQPVINEVKGGRVGGFDQHHSLPPTYSCEDPLPSNPPGPSSERRLHEASFSRNHPGPAGPSMHPPACSGLNSQPRSDFFQTNSYHSSAFNGQSAFPGVHNGAHNYHEQHHGFPAQFYPPSQHCQYPQFYQPYQSYPHISYAPASMPPPSLLGNGPSNSVVLSNIKVNGNLTINHGSEGTSKQPYSNSANLQSAAKTAEPPSENSSADLPCDTSQQKPRQSDEVGLRPVYPLRNDCKEVLMRQGSTTLSSSDPSYRNYRSQFSTFSGRSLFRSSSHVRSRMPTEQDSLCDTNCHSSAGDPTPLKMLHADVHLDSIKESQRSFARKPVADENALFSSTAHHNIDDITSIAVQETSDLNLNDDSSLLSTVIDQSDDCSSACLPS